MTDAEIRKRLLKAGRHLSPTRFGWVITRVCTPGIDWGGSPKGQAIAEVAAILGGRIPPHRRYQASEFTLEQVEQALRRQSSALPGRRGGRS